jgi:two-component system sensor histidine kinase RegB
MNESTKINTNTNQKNLRQLLILRAIAIFAQIATIIFVDSFLEISLPKNLMFLVIFLLALFSVKSFYNLKKNNVSDKNLFIELLFDVVAFALQIYLSGGISNPIISLFLLQVIIGAILLKPLFSWLIALITFIFYLLLSKFFYVINFDLIANSAMQNHHHNHHDNFSLHLQGMLVSYIILAILLIIFIGKIIKNIRDGEQKIHDLEQQFLKEKQMVEIALFATSSAHNLGSPLSTISVIISDWKKIHHDKNLQDDIKIIDSQLQKCKNILSEILNYSGKSRLESFESQSLKNCCENLVKNWQKNYEIKELQYDFLCTIEQPFFFDNILMQAIYNVFNNAFEAYKNIIKITFSNDENNLIIKIIDDGNGFDEKVLKNLGKPNLSTKKSSGFGLHLTIKTLEKINGNLIVKNIKNHGAQVEILIPFKYYEKL